MLAALLLAGSGSPHANHETNGHDRRPVQHVTHTARAVQELRVVQPIKPAIEEEPARGGKERGDREAQLEADTLEVARDSARYALWQVGLNAAGLLGLFISLGLTRKAVRAAESAGRDTGRALEIAARNADAASRQVEASLKTSFEQRRPWIKISVEVLTFEQHTPDEIIASVKLTAQNVGKSPAIAPAGLFRVYLWNGKQQLPPIDVNPTIPTQQPLFPGEEFTHSMSRQFNEAERRVAVEDARIVGGNPVIVFDVGVEYDGHDISNRRVTATRFLLLGGGRAPDWLTDPYLPRTFIPHGSMRRYEDEVIT